MMGRLFMVTDLNNLVRLTKSQIKTAGEMFARAFQDYPLATYFIPDAFERKNKSHYPFECLIHYGVLYGEVYATSPNLEGVVVWLPSEKAEMTLWGMIRCGGLSLYFKVGRKVVSRVLAFFEYASKVHNRHAPFPHWYLTFMAVDPVFQGRGYASALIKPMLARIDQEHLHCYLEPQNEKNVPIYQHYGFKVVEVDTIPGTDVKNWAMLREKSC